MNDLARRCTHLEEQLARHPRAQLAHVPTPLEPLNNLTEALDGPRLWVKRDDCTGLAFGGNKARQLEYYFGAAQAQQADTILITSAMQSNYVRTAAAAARKLGMICHIQLEDRVPHDHDDVPYHSSGNVLLDRLLGATLHHYPEGEDEEGADAELGRIAEELREAGRQPYIIPLSPQAKPLGALGYVRAAIELAGQIQDLDLSIGEIFLASGSAFTHAGLLFGLRALGIDTAVTGVCVRRGADRQVERVADRVNGIGELLELPIELASDDIRLVDDLLAPGYGQLNDATFEAMQMSAHQEGLLLDPVYTGKAMAGLIHCLRQRPPAGPGDVLFIHTGGQPALFGYATELETRLGV